MLWTRTCPSTNSADGRATMPPFPGGDESGYRHWRAGKLTAFTDRLECAADSVDIADPRALSGAEFVALTERCRRCNLAFYRARACEKRETLRQLCAQLGLHTPAINPCADRDGISRIEAVPETRYIPYTQHPLRWHTDGYYNPPADTVGAFAMHCVRPAVQGGENQYFDPEILYILLRDENPDYVAALMHPQTLTIPEDPETARAGDSPKARSAPVLAQHPQNASLVMRYTMRRRHIVWRNDKVTTAARAFIDKVLQTPGRYHISRRLDAGEGVVCNNVLHNRSEFEDTNRSGRLLYRTRYRERIARNRAGTQPG